MFQQHSKSVPTSLDPALALRLLRREAIDIDGLQRSQDRW